MLALPIWVWPALVLISVILTILFLKFGDGLLSSGFNGNIDDVMEMSRSHAEHSTDLDSQ